MAASLSRAFAREIKLKISLEDTYGKSRMRITVSAGLIPPRLRKGPIPYQSTTQPGVSRLQTEIQVRRSGTAVAVEAFSPFQLPPLYAITISQGLSRTVHHAIFICPAFILDGRFGNGSPLATVREYKYLRLVFSLQHPSSGPSSSDREAPGMQLVLISCCGNSPAVKRIILET